MAFKRDEKFHEVEGTIEAQTLKAYLFWRNGDDKPCWLPKSQVELVKPSDGDGPAVIRMTDWIFRQKEWNDDD
jgi:hypothetical protein